MVNRKGKRVDFYLDDDIYNNMISLCENHKITKSEFLRKAVKTFVDINNAAEVRKRVKDGYLSGKAHLNINKQSAQIEREVN